MLLSLNTILIIVIINKRDSETSCTLIQNPPLKKIKDGKNCYEKEKLPLIELAVNQIY
jgi:hypothetical protein